MDHTQLPARFVPPDARAPSALDRRRFLQAMGMGGVALTLPGLLAGCAAGGAGGAASTGELLVAEKVTWALGSGLASLDWATEFSAAGWVNLSNSMESPLQFRADGTTEPALAESVEQPDDLTFLLTLRQGVTFWDGSPLTADDVVFSLLRNVTGDTSAGATYYGAVQGVEAVGPDQVRITLNRVDPLFALVLAHPATYVTSRAYLERAGDRFGTAEFPGMGTGAMRIDSFNPRTGMSMSRHDGYWGEPSNIGSWETRFITDVQALLLAFQSGEIDGCQDVPPDSLPVWEQAGAAVGGPLGGYLWFGWSFPMEQAPFDDVHVRRAFAHATDAAGLAASAGGASAQPSGPLVTPELFGLLADQPEIDALYAGLATYPFDMERARAELAQSSVPGGFTATVTIPNTFPQLNAIAQNTAQNLAQIGVTLEIQEAPEESVIPEKWLGLPPNDGHVDSGLLLRLVYGAPLPDPGDVLGQVVPSSATEIGAQNSARYADPRVDELLGQASATTDRAVRFAAFSEVLQILAEDVPYAGAFFGGSPWAVKRPWGWNPDATNAYLVLRPWFRELRA